MAVRAADDQSASSAATDSRTGHQNKKQMRKATSHKDVTKYPMKSRLRVPNEENPSWTRVCDGFFASLSKICVGVNKENDLAILRQVNKMLSGLCLDFMVLCC